MSLDFPNSPSVNDVYTVGNSSWIWTGSVWKKYPSLSSEGPTGPTGPTGATGDTGPTGPTGPAFDNNSPTFTGYVEFTGIVDFTESVVIGIDALPSQTNQSGKYLTTDGTDASWAEIPAGSPHPFSMLG